MQILHSPTGYAFFKVLSVDGASLLYEVHMNHPLFPTEGMKIGFMSLSEVVLAVARTRKFVNTVFPSLNSVINHRFIMRQAASSRIDRCEFFTHIYIEVQESGKIWKNREFENNLKSLGISLRVREILRATDSS